MSGLEWILVPSLGGIYLALMLTVAVVTFQKGHMALFIIGIFLPDPVTHRRHDEAQARKRLSRVALMIRIA